MSSINTLPCEVIELMSKIHLDYTDYPSLALVNKHFYQVLHNEHMLNKYHRARAFYRGRKKLQELLSERRVYSTYSISLSTCVWTIRTHLGAKAYSEYYDIPVDQLKFPFLTISNTE